VFVKVAYRGQGIARKMLAKLESRARQQGYKTMVLETGELLAASMKLYKSFGYEITENYGQYAEMAESICMKKLL
jgi:Sortase and related acyltransferases